MVKHVVMWKMKESAGGAGKIENQEKLREMLEGLEDKIHQIQGLEVGLKTTGIQATHDVILITEFKSMNELDAYLNHPEHKRVAAFVGEVTAERVSVDFICK